MKRTRVKLRRKIQAICRWWHDSWYWIKCRLWHRYNVVVCRPLPPTWCDRDYNVAANNYFGKFAFLNKV